MTETKLPLSVQICTLNEERNIEACLKNVLENCPAEITVIDGGSSDKTVLLASSMGARVIKAGRIGLAKQRQLGIESTHLPYIALIDADDRIEPNCLGKLLQQMKDGNYKAIQANVQSHSNNTYWQRAWGLFCSVNINEPGPTTIVGRPALFETNSIQQIGFDPFFTYGSEDTDISYRFEKAGLSQGIGTGISFRIHPDSFSECKKKWISYGRGYARFAFKHPERKRGIIKHLLWNIPFKRNFKTIRSGHFSYFPFYLLYGFFCFTGFRMEMQALRQGKFKSDFGRS
jgi:glycosyltransferase involved in cell wall biosynthesis